VDTIEEIKEFLNTLDDVKIPYETVSGERLKIIRENGEE